MRLISPPLLGSMPPTRLWAWLLPLLALAGWMTCFWVVVCPDRPAPLGKRGGGGAWQRLDDAQEHRRAMAGEACSYPRLGTIRWQHAAFTCVVWQLAPHPTPPAWSLVSRVDTAPGCLRAIARFGQIVQFHDQARDWPQPTVAAITHHSPPSLPPNLVMSSRAAVQGPMSSWSADGALCVGVSLDPVVATQITGAKKTREEVKEERRKKGKRERGPENGLSVLSSVRTGPEPSPPTSSLLASTTHTRARSMVGWDLKQSVFPRIQDMVRVRVMVMIDDCKRLPRLLRLPSGQVVLGRGGQYSGREWALET